MIDNTEKKEWPKICQLTILCITFPYVFYPSRYCQEKQKCAVNLYPALTFNIIW